MIASREKQCPHCLGLFTPWHLSRKFCSEICAITSHVKVAGTRECWLWASSVNDTGYGTYRLPDRSITAHRFIYAYFKGPVPNGMCVCHTCDNPACCNPSHLFLGTRRDNMRDMVKKGRNACTVGVRNPRARLNEEAIKVIRHPSLAHKTHVQLAAAYGVTPGMIGHVRAGRNWT